MVLLAVLPVLFPCVSPAQEWLLGSVVSVDTEGRSFVVRTEQQGAGDAGSGSDITIRFDEGDVPMGLVPGKTVRVLATDDETGAGFVAKRVTVFGTSSRGVDRTGVRSRLNMGRGWGGGGAAGGGPGFGRGGP